MIDDSLEALRARLEAFVAEIAIPLESHLGDGEVPDRLRRKLHDEARAAGLFAPHVGTEWGGLGLDHRGQSVIFEEAGYSPLGPVALNCAAPDEGNMQLLAAIATDAQKERYLRPLAGGEVRSCFAMTEPAPGAGSDPAMLATTATRTGDGWSLRGRKWYVTGADGAAFAIVMARAEDDGGATMFLIDAGAAGFEVVRRIDSIDDLAPGGHCELAFEDCKVGDDAVLGEVGRGFDYAQVRLAPARLTHCMRWLGIARRAHDIALDRASEREAFGAKLGDLGMVQHMLADNEIDIAAGRSLVRHAAWVLDTGSPGRHETSIAKTFVSEAVNRVVDRCVQVCGSLGVSGDLPLALFLREVRPFRIYDGPSETHRWSIARRALRRRTQKDSP